MKVKIEKTFKDKYTGEQRIAGSVVDFEDSRAAELLADPRKVVSSVKEEEEAPAKPKKRTTKKK